MKIELELPDKPEVHAIASMLSIDSDTVVGKLLRVWQWFDKHTVDGNAYGVTYSLPDRLVSVNGFGEAMAFVGWLEQHDKMLVMPKFDRHTSESAKQRALTAKRVAKHKVKSNEETNADSVTNALPREEKILTTDTNVSVVGNEVANQSNIFQLNAKPNCPHQEIIALYHEIIAVGTRVKVWNGTRAAHLKARWNEDAKRQTLDYWRRLFTYCTESPFLMGRVNGKDREPFQISLPWIVMPNNFAKIIEQTYHREQA